MEKLKVLIADTYVTDRRLIAEAVGRTSLGTVVHTAPNSSIALEWLQQCPMDVILLGASMAGQDMLIKAKAAQPDIEVIIISDGNPRSAGATIRALEQGAFDFVLKVFGQDAEKTVEAVRSQLDVLFAQIKVKKYSRPDACGSPEAACEKACLKFPAARGRAGAQAVRFGKPELVLFASSTGGPAALEAVFRQLPGSFPAPVLVVQHMPAEFTAAFAQSLDKVSEMEIVEARDGSPLKAGRAVIAAGGQHMKVSRPGGKDAVITLDRSPYVNGVRPAADVLFKSAAEAYEGRSVLAVIFTGMGNDGTCGVSELKSRCGCYCITQSESTSVVYGMPRCAREAGLSDETADIGDMAGRIYRLSL